MKPSEHDIQSIISSMGAPEWIDGWNAGSGWKSPFPLPFSTERDSPPKAKKRATPKPAPVKRKPTKKQAKPKEVPKLPQADIIDI